MGQSVPAKQLEIEFRSHGGKREGAGRKTASKRPPVHHVKRPEVPTRSTAHVTLRVRRDVPSLRSQRFIRDFQSRLRVGCERGNFRVCHFSIQGDHVHLVVEVSGKEALGCGMKSVGIRLARTVNRVFGRVGPVLFGRYHLRVLRTPREVRHALAYVLLNARKHWRQRKGIAPPVALDIVTVIALLAEHDDATVAETARATLGKLFDGCMTSCFEILTRTFLSPCNHDAPYTDRLWEDGPDD